MQVGIRGTALFSRPVRDAISSSSRWIVDLFLRHSRNRPLDPNKPTSNPPHHLPHTKHSTTHPSPPPQSLPTPSQKLPPSTRISNHPNPPNKNPRQQNPQPPARPKKKLHSPSVLPAGIGPIPLSPYPNSGGIVSTLLSPIHISNNPSSHPLITCPFPTVKSSGVPLLYEASNSEPSEARVPR